VLAPLGWDAEALLPLVCALLRSWGGAVRCPDGGTDSPAPSTGRTFRSPDPTCGFMYRPITDQVDLHPASPRSVGFGPSGSGLDLDPLCLLAFSSRIRSVRDLDLTVKLFAQVRASV
jgi:hypothetical protein